MCGIIGLCSRQDMGVEHFDDARDVMRARGPDAYGTEQFTTANGRSVKLGHRRLSIQDLSNAGHQPMTSASGRYVIVYNGEVYNAPDLRKQLQAAGCFFRSNSDTEVILEGFSFWGPSVVQRLHGIFAFGIWDTVEECLFAARDRVGVKPFCFWQGNGEFAFASDARALRALGFGQDIDEQSMALYLCLGYVPSPRSIWKGVTKLEAGCTLEWSPTAGVRKVRYWAAPDDTDYVASSGPLEQLLDEIVEEQLLSDVPIGLFLSGGLDSSVIASSLVGLGASAKAVTALSVGFPGNESADESPVAEKTAKQLGLRYRKLELAANTRPYYAEAVAALDEPLAYSAIVTQTAISKLAMEVGLKVVLSGDGGDEVFGGYRWYARTLGEMKTSIIEGGPPISPFTALFPFHRKRQQTHERTAAFLAKDPLFAHAIGVFRGLLPVQVAEMYPAVSEPDIVDLLWETLTRHDAPRLAEKRRRQRIDLYTFCQDVVLPKVDRAGMAYGVEVRPPLLDHRLVDWALSRPISDADDAAPKNALREIVNRRGLGFLLEQPKRGFSLQSRNRMSRFSMRADISQRATKIGLSRNWARHLRSRRGDRLELDTLFFLSSWHEMIEVPPERT